jgi:probable O-glycosylation ligase (exosortase A-associated)
MRYAAVRIVRWGLAATLALSLVTVVMTFSRGGFIGLLVLALFLIKNSRNKFITLFLVAAAGVAIYLSAPSTWFSRLDTIQDASSDGSFMGRVIAWKMSWLIARDHPFFGGGPHAVQHIAVWDQYKPLLPSLDFIHTPPPDIVPHAAHSIYFEMLGDMGFTGLFLFLAVLGCSFWNCHVIIRKSRKRPSLTWASDIARMAQVSLAVYMVTGAALSMGYFELLYIFVALLSRCKRIVLQTVASEALASSPLLDEESDFDVEELAPQFAHESWH